MSDQDNGFENLMNAVSVLIGYQNLVENRLQSAQNDVQAANDAQAHYLLNEMNKRFDELNSKLDEILRKMEE